MRTPRYWPTLAKINGRYYYWAIEEVEGKDHVRTQGKNHTLVCDGCSHKRDGAVEALTIALETLDPGADDFLEGRNSGSSKAMRYWLDKDDFVSVIWSRAYTAGADRARHLYSKHYARRRPAKGSDACADDLGHIWEFDPVEQILFGGSGWRAYRITKITPKRVFIYYEPYERQLSFDRAELEACGSIAARRSGAYLIFYTEAGKAEADEADCVTELDARDSSHFKQPAFLKLSGTPTREEIMCAFREKALEIHPDHGGDAEAFRQLCIERDWWLTRTSRAA